MVREEFDNRRVGCFIRCEKRKNSVHLVPLAANMFPELRLLFQYSPFTEDESRGAGKDLQCILTEEFKYISA